MNNGVVLCLVTALGFGVWPLIARWSGAEQSWTTTIVSTITAMVVVSVQATKLSTVPTGRVVGLLLLAGLVNGVGWLTYGRLVAGTEFDVSRFAPAALTLMIAFIAVGGVLVFGEPLTATKAVGIVLAIAAAWLLNLQ